MRRRVAEVMVILGLCVMAVTATTAAQDSPVAPVETAPVATPEPTPSATPEPTPVATPEPTPEPTPEATPEPAPEPPPVAAAQSEPAPAQTEPELTAAPRQAVETVTFCHATGSASAPYVAITLPKGELLGHDAHPADLIPAPAGGCPSTAQAPVPTPTPEPAATPEPSDEVTICHATGRAFVELTVSRRGLAVHRRHSGDLIPAPEGGCPEKAATPRPEPEPQPQPAAPQPTPEPPHGNVLGDSESGSAPAPKLTAAPPAPAPAAAPAAAAPATRVQGSQLAYTGADAFLLGLLGLGMALAGAGLFLVTAEPPRPR